MATNKKSTGSSKTAHVMNLLSKNRSAPVAPSEPSSEEISNQSPAPAPTDTNSVSVPTPQTAPTKEASIAPMMASIAPDAAVSAQIKNALEDALLAEALLEPTPEPTPTPESAPVPAPIPEPIPAPPIPAPEPNPVPAPEPEQVPTPIPEQVPVATTVPSETSKESEMICVDVMKILVEESAPKYIKMFHLCPCEQCAIDVIALALTNLQAKYVVMKRQHLNARLALYEGRFRTEVIAQILHACKVIHENPHHNFDI